MDDKWIKDIREKMSELEMTPPGEMWDDIMKETIARRHRKKIIVSMSIAASIAFIVCFSFIFSSDYNSNSDLLEIPVLTYEPTPESFSRPQKIEGENFIAQKTQTSCETKPTSSPLPESCSERIIEDNDRADYASELSINPEQDNTIVYEPDARQENIETTADVFFNEESLSAIEERYDDGGSKHTSDKPRFSLGASTSANGIGACLNGNNFPASSLNPNSQAQTRMGGGILSDWPLYGDSESAFKSAGDIFDHRLPLRFSISLSFNFSKSLSFDSGICYSYLKSDIRYSGLYTGYSNAVQKLHFIGIPIGLRYTPFSTHHLDFYAAGGGMIEKCISGKLESDSNSAKPYSYPGSTERPFQFSLSTSIGMQYNIAKEFGIYIEPGVGYYIKNGSRLRTIYSERPVTFNLNVGIRFMK